MTSKPVTVVALLKVQAGKEEAVRRELTSQLGPSRKDAGCLNYDLHRSTDNPGHFMFHENWATKADLDRHLAKPELQAVLKRVGTMLTEPAQILLWEKLD